MPESRARERHGWRDKIPRIADLIAKGMVNVRREDQFDTVFFDQRDQAVSRRRVDRVVMPQPRLIFIPQIQGQMKKEEQPPVLVPRQFGFQPLPLRVRFGHVRVENLRIEHHKMALAPVKTIP